MCGIAGFVGPQDDPETLRHVAASMARSIQHRGPDDHGTWVDAAAGVAFGHQRLAIIDISASGHQPMVSADGRFVADFNGEIYNFRVLRHELQHRGVRFRGGSDTEVLVEAIATWGVEATLQRSMGMFAFAIWDRQRRRLVLARDRLGEKPLYYGWCGSTFLFGSELKALRRHPAFRNPLDRDAMALLLGFGYVPTPHSIYEGIRKLPPGTWLEIDPTRTGLMPDPAEYWSLKQAVEQAKAEPFAGSPKEAVDRLEDLLRASVRQQMIADVPLGAFLSGGIDSSTIVALMQSESARPVRTFSIGFAESDYDEAPFARAVAKHIGTDHTELEVSWDDALAVVPRLPEMYDEPFSDSSQIPTYLVSQLASAHVRVSLSGDGGDELFGGYPRYLEHRGMWRTFGWMPPSVRRGIGTLLRALPIRVWDGIGRLARPLLPERFTHVSAGHLVYVLATMLGEHGPEALFRRFVGQFEDPAQLVEDASVPRWPFENSEAPRRVRDVTERMMFLDTMTYLPDDILVKVDRAAMASSLETRVPFLDPELVGFVWSLPRSFKDREGETKWILRRTLDRHVPRALVDRPKMGFSIPLAEWLRGPLRDWAECHLSEARLRDRGLRPELIRRTWHEHLSGERNWAYRLWAVLMLQEWLDRHAP